MKKNKCLSQLSIFFIVFILTGQIGLSQSSEKYFNIASQKSDSSDFIGAIKYYTICIEMEPNLMEAYFNRGLVKSNLKDFKGAILDYNKCILLDSLNSNFFYNRARASYFLKDYKNCIIDNSRVIKLDPNFGLAYLNRGLVNNIIGNTIEGCIDLFKAKELHAKNAEEAINHFCK